LTETLHPEETITSFTLIRHGHTRATEQGLLYSDPNAELTEKGIQQADQAADWLAKNKPEVLLSSPALRVRSSSEIIAKRVDMSIEIMDGLDEWHIGDWEGRTYLDIKKNDPDLYQKWSADPIHNAPPGGESIQQLAERASNQLREMIAKYKGKRIALITHAGIVRSIIVHALEMPVENFWRISIPTGSISKVDFSDNFATVHFLGLRPGENS
jgi:ribonuclease H / adenosylcobalamin/alpha-ribazole phosphatase